MQWKYFRNRKLCVKLLIIIIKNNVENNLVKYALAERNVLSVTNYPFIVKLNYAF